MIEYYLCDLLFNVNYYIVQVWFDYRPTQINFILNQNRIIHLYKLIILRESRADLLSGCQVVTVKGKGLRLYFL